MDIATFIETRDYVIIGEVCKSRVLDSETMLEIYLIKKRFKYDLYWYSFEFRVDAITFVR